MNTEINHPLFNTSLSTLQEINIPRFTARGIKLYVKRDDLIHNEVSGNKWRKLKYNLLQVQHGNYAGVFTFGGAYSNHLLATASAANRANIKSIGLVRGEELTENSNNTLKRCAELGMQLIFISREEYALRNDKQYIDELKSEHTNFYFVPEGGGNYLGIVGCQEIWKEIDQKIDEVFVAQGTTATSCGVLLGKPTNCKLHVIPVLKGFDAYEEMLNKLKWFLFQEDLAKELLEEVIFHHHYHFGGYGKYTPELLTFIQEIYHAYKIPLDPIYTAKAFYGMLQELEAKTYHNKDILFIHTGGIQVCKEIELKNNISLFTN
jgi:1-aminocyclopropane-1-carboxylate deaminase